MTKIETMHKGLELIDVLKGNGNVYQAFFMNMDQNKALKKKTLGTPVRQLVDAEQDPYVDLTITMKKQGDENVLPFVPQVRVFF